MNEFVGGVFLGVMGGLLAWPVLQKTSEQQDENFYRQFYETRAAENCVIKTRASDKDCARWAKEILDDPTYEHLTESMRPK